MWCFAIIHLVLIISLKWVHSLSIYLIVCINRWIVLCRDVPKVNYDIWTIDVQISKNSKDYGSLPKFDSKNQVVFNLIIELSASLWIVTPNYILNLINWRYKIDGLYFVRMFLKEIWYLTHRGFQLKKLKRWWNFVGIELKL